MRNNSTPTAPVVICVGGNGTDCATGKNVEDAYLNYKDITGSEEPAEDCSFYDAVEFAIETKILRKETLVRK